MADDGYLQDVALMVEKGFLLTDIWNPLPWEGEDMPEDFIEVFAMIYRKIENERVQKLG